jgi:hypothetical protein
MVVLWPSFEWAPLQAFMTLMVLLVVSVLFQDYD